MTYYLTIIPDHSCDVWTAPEEGKLKHHKRLLGAQYFTDDNGIQIPVGELFGFLAYTTLDQHIVYYSDDLDEIIGHAALLAL